MKHYEVVFMVHPDQSDQVPGMVERYAAMIERAAGRCIAPRIGVVANSPIPFRKSTRRTMC